MKHIFTLIIALLFAGNVYAQQSPYIDYSNSGESYNVNMGATFGLGSDIFDINTFVGLSNNHARFGAGVDAISGYLLGYDIFIGFYGQYATSVSQSSYLIFSQKSGLKFNVLGAKLKVYTSFESHKMNYPVWVPLGASLSF